MCGSSERLRALLLADPERLRILQCVRSLRLPDAWVAAGVVRSAVWDQAHGRPPGRSFGDVDVVWFEPGRDDDDSHEDALRVVAPEFEWSVKNQARMHRRNGDAPYASATDAMRFWPETATATGVRLEDDGSIAIAAPFGLDDLFHHVLRPTPLVATSRAQVFRARLVAKH